MKQTVYVTDIKLDKIKLYVISDPFMTDEMIHKKAESESIWIDASKIIEIEDNETNKETVIHIFIPRKNRSRLPWHGLIVMKN